jgi:hypothetical protein
MLLVECNVLEQVKVINEGTKGKTKVRLQGKFQKCDEQNNNGRIYPKAILESQVKAIQEKIGDRSLVGALDHPTNDAIHLSQASHLITKLWVEKNGDVMGECEILSTPNGKIVEALLNDGVKLGISSRGIGSVTEGIKGKLVNEDFKLITFDLVSDPSTRGAFPGICESMRENSERAQRIVSKHKKDRVLLTMLESKITQALESRAAETPTANKTPAQLSRQVTKTPADRKMAVAHKLEKGAADKEMRGHPGAKSSEDSAASARTAAVATAKEEEKKRTPTKPKGKQGMFNFGESIKKALKGKKKKLDKNNNGELDSEDFEILRGDEGVKEDFFDQWDKDTKKKKEKVAAMKKPGGLYDKSTTATKLGRMRTNGPVTMEPEKPHSSVRRADRASTDIIGNALIEGFKKVCWGDRYDENKFSDLDVQRQERRRQPNEERFENPTTAASQSGKHFTGGRGEVANDGEMVHPEDKEVANKRAERLRKRTALQAKLGEAVVKALKERCWKGYEPTPGKKAYSKGSCKPKGKKK